MKLTSLSNLIVFISILVIAQTSFLANSSYLIILAIIILAIVVYFKKEFKPFIFNIFVVWIILNVISTFFLGREINFTRILSVFIQILFIPYIILTFVDKNFWNRFEKIIYLLTFISLPIFLLNTIFPDFYNSLTPIMRTFTRDIFYLSNSSIYWTSLFYVNAIQEGNLYRNSGFMWEPGAFAMMIIWALIYNTLKKREGDRDVNYKRKLIIYAVAMITTFSTAGYIALFVFFIAYYLRNKVSIKALSYIVVINVIFIFFIIQLDFIGGEISQYIESYQKGKIAYSQTHSAYKVNRFEIVKFDVLKVAKYPLGYGVSEEIEDNYSEKIVGVNGLSNFMLLWGFPIFVIFLILIWRYFKMINENQIPFTPLLIFYISLMIMFFSNPIGKNIFPYLMVFSVLGDMNFRKKIFK